MNHFEKRKKGIKLISEGPKNPRFSPKDIDRIIYLYENNIDLKEIAKHFNRNVTTIWRTVIRYNAKRLTLKDVLDGMEEIE